MPSTALVASTLLSLVSAAGAQTHENRLRPGDGVRVEIKNEPDLSKEFIIGADGQLLLPLLGTIKAADRPFSELHDELTRGFGAELADPVVRITPLVRVSVLGEVRMPGLFLIDPTFTVMDVLARAGGLLPTANQRRIVIRRPTGVVVAQFNLDSPPLGTALGSGDQIMVARRSWVSEHMGIMLSAAGSVAVALITSVLVR